MWLREHVGRATQSSVVAVVFRTLRILMVTHLSNHINNPSIRFRVPKNLDIESNITSLAQLLTE